MKKLTLVSFTINGLTKSVFIELEYKEEKPVLEMDVMNSLIEQEFGYLPPRGITISIG